MKKHLLFSIATISLLLFSNTSFSQTVNLGVLESFEGYTGAGAVTNAAGATWTGDAGTNIGIISGFGLPPSFTGNTYNANAVTLQCRFDLFRLYIHLNDLYVDHPATHAAAFGGGETITPGVYSIPGAGSIGAALTLDGGGNPNAFFVIKFYGAMTVGANAVINLTGGTQSCNVFFIAEGAISVAADCNLKGTLFSKIGAVGLGANTVLEGRMLSMQGALVNGAGAKASPPPGTCTIPINCDFGCSAAPAVDVLGVLSNYALYTNVGAVPNTSTSGINGNIGTNSGSVSGFEDSIVIGSIHNADASTTQANIDLDNAYIKLMALPNTVPTPESVLPKVLAHAASFGSVAPGGETINAGVYFIDGAGSLLGTLVLDGQDNTNSIFVFKFAGAFSVAAQAKMILINGARRCNVFWIGGAGVPTGAISIGAGAVLKGTFLSHGGACGSGADVFLAGRQLSTGGAVNTYSGIIYNNPECITSTSLTRPKIAALADSPSVLPGTNTPSVIENDSLNGAQAVIGTAPGQVTLTSTPNGPLTMNADGTITVSSNTPVGSYPITYTICEVSNPTNCSTVTSNVTVTAPVIAAVTDSPSVLPGTNTPSVIGNDKLNGVQAVIGTAPGQVTLTSTPNGPLTMNADGTITVASNTPVGSYPITYTICEVSNPTNCSTVTSNVTVTAPGIAAVTDSPIVLPGTNTPSVIGNDKLNGVQAVIGTAPGQVTLTSTPNGP
ncbi:ice-binding family protein, partial [Flavobacterium sp. LS2R12]